MKKPHELSLNDLTTFGSRAAFNAVNLPRQKNFMELLQNENEPALKTEELRSAS